MQAVINAVSLTQPIFNHKRIASYGEVMVAYTEQMLNTWQDGETRDINADMMRLTLSIVMKTIFTLDLTQTEAKDIMMMAWYETNRQLDFPIPYWFPTPLFFNIVLCCDRNMA
ncbi:hypothetical protein [Microseira sp. BLCC-F43]|jgi:cytochrome P450|uniref:hypothetical protein n=1 Tax=Microseira sp. BLCC-F43 TaxID=3153602 RepID=UPI0035B9F380